MCIYVLYFRLELEEGSTECKSSSTATRDVHLVNLCRGKTNLLLKTADGIVHYDLFSMDEFTLQSYGFDCSVVNYDTDLPAPPRDREGLLEEAYNLATARANDVSDEKQEEVLPLLTPEYITPPRENVSGVGRSLVSGSDRTPSRRAINRDVTWQCPRCTLINSNERQRCGACDLPCPDPSEESDADGMNDNIMILDTDNVSSTGAGWWCSQCTFINQISRET